MSGWRRIVVDGVVYRWRAGGSGIDVRRADGAVVGKSFNEPVIGVSSWAYERGQHKGTADGAVMPHQVGADARKP